MHISYLPLAHMFERMVQVRPWLQGGTFCAQNPEPYHGAACHWCHEIALNRPVLRQVPQGSCPSREDSGEDPSSASSSPWVYLLSEGPQVMAGAQRELQLCSTVCTIHTLRRTAPLTAKTSPDPHFQKSPTPGKENKTVKLGNQTVMTLTLEMGLAL